jgi:MarR family transcriptional regulator, lower aerobic nicotinate degradation pathway regulator
MPSSHKTTAIKAELKAAQLKSRLFSRPGFLIRRLHQVHTGLFADETAQFDVTAVQYSLLTALAEHGEMDQNTLALEIGLERTSVAEVLPRLEARGLLARQQSPSDGRVKLVKLTRLGGGIVKRMDAAVQRAHDRTIEVLPENERELFMLQLIRLVEANNDRSMAPLKLR